VAYDAYVAALTPIVELYEAKRRRLIRNMDDQCSHLNALLQAGRDRRALRFRFGGTLAQGLTSRMVECCLSGIHVRVQAALALRYAAELRRLRDHYQPEPAWEPKTT